MGHYSDSPKPENSGRMGRRLGYTSEPSAENFTPVLMNDPTSQDPQPLTHLPNENEPKSASAPKDPPQKKKQETKTSSSAPNQNTSTSSDAQNDTEESKAPEEPKEKYSIYLPPKLSMALRMAYTVSRKNKYSHVVETALTDMLYNRFQCNNPNCLVRFSMSETDITPMYCPYCGKKDLTPLRIDILV